MKLIRLLSQTIVSLGLALMLSFCAGALARLFASCLMAGWRWMGGAL